MDDYLGLGILPPEVGNMLWLYSDMSGAKAGPENHLFINLGGNIVSQILVGDKEYLLSIQAFNDLDSISRSATNI